MSSHFPWSTVEISRQRKNSFPSVFEYAAKNIFQIILIIASLLILCAQIHDGLDVIQLENQIHHKVGLTSGELITTVYTSSSEVEIRFKKTPASPLKLKIQKVQLFFKYVTVYFNLI
jgi:hypothetical protein